MTTAQEGNLSAWLEERFCRSTVQIRAYMSSKFNIHHSHSGCIKLLARLGFEYRKPKVLPRANVSFTSFGTMPHTTKAQYQKSPDVRAFLSRKNCRIYLIQLPPYYPYLNPIERLWAVMHSHVTHNRHYPKQKHFANAILNFMREALPKQWLSFRDQVTDNFRVISHRNVRVFE